MMTGPDPTSQQITAHALLIGDRINTAGFEGQVLSNTPLAVRIGRNGLAVVFRYGVAVFLGLSADEEAEFLERLHPRTFGKITPYEEEFAKVQVARESDEPIPPGGPIPVREMSLERLLVVADALAKSVVLARDERQVANVVDTVEPFARELARAGRKIRRTEVGFVEAVTIRSINMAPCIAHGLHRPLNTSYRNRFLRLLRDQLRSATRDRTRRHITYCKYLRL